MADEQIIYLSPEEELTNVRERLEQVPAKRVVLIIPQQTQLRSLVGWRLLHSRARELGKDILIISSDRQIRSVVKAAGFRVADSLASPPSSGKSRSDSRSSRTNTGNKPTPHLRSSNNKEQASQQPAQQGPRQPSQPLSSMPPIQPLQNYPSISDIPTIDYELETNKPRDNEPTTRGSASPDPSSTFDTRNRQLGPNYDFRVGEIPPIHPLMPDDDEDDPDLWIEDVSHAQSLRDAALQEPDSINRSLPPVSASQYQSDSSFEDMTHDPLAFMDDIPSSPLPEQKGAVNFDDIDEEMPDISDYPTDVISDSDIEDLGDQGNIVENPRSWADMLQDERDIRDIQDPPRVHGVRPRSSRSGIMQPPPSQDDFDDEDEDGLPPIYDQPTRIQPPPTTPQRPDVPPPATPKTGSRTFSVAQNEPRPVSLPQNRSAQQKQQRPTPTRSQQPAKTGINRSRAIGAAGSASAAQSNKGKAAARPKRKSSEIVMPIAIVILILLIIGAVVYFVPTADVTVGIPFKNYSLKMTLSANGTSTQNTTNGTVQAQTLTYDTSLTDKGTPTGTSSVGNAQATGSVNFTNKSSQPIEIPIGMQLSTSSGVIFTTTVDVELSPVNSPYNQAPVTVQAQNPGTIGNVRANTIVNITPTGQTLLLQFNPQLTPGSIASALTLTNPQPTTGGGAGKATALSTNDVNTLKAKLNTEAQTKLKNWLTQQLHGEDQAGKPVLAETVTTTPTVGSVIPNGTFSETMKLHATVLVVRAVALQSAAFATMNNSVSKNKLYSGYTLYQQQRLNITQIKNTSSSNGRSLKLSFTASGQIIPNVSVDQIRSLLAGKKVSEVQSTLTGPGGIPGIVTSSAVVNPSFLPWLPFLSSHITVHLVPAQPPTVPHIIHPTPTPKKK